MPDRATRAQYRFGCVIQLGLTSRPLVLPTAAPITARKVIAGTAKGTVKAEAATDSESSTLAGRTPCGKDVGEGSRLLPSKAMDAILDMLGFALIWEFFNQSANITNTPCCCALSELDRLWESASLNTFPPSCFRYRDDLQDIYKSHKARIRQVV